MDQKPSTKETESEPRTMIYGDAYIPDCCKEEEPCEHVVKRPKKPKINIAL